MMRLLLSALFVAAPLLAGPAFAGDLVPVPAAVSPPQSTAPAATTPQVTPIPSSERGYGNGPGGCPLRPQQAKERGDVIRRGLDWECDRPQLSAAFRQFRLVPAAPMRANGPEIELQAQFP